MKAQTHPVVECLRLEPISEYIAIHGHNDTVLRFGRTCIEVIKYSEGMTTFPPTEHKIFNGVDLLCELQRICECGDRWRIFQIQNVYVDNRMVYVLVQTQNDFMMGIIDIEDIVLDLKKLFIVFVPVIQNYIRQLIALNTLAYEVINVQGQQFKVKIFVVGYERDDYNIVFHKLDITDKVSHFVLTMPEIKYIQTFPKHNGQPIIKAQFLGNPFQCIVVNFMDCYFCKVREKICGNIKVDYQIIKNFNIKKMVEDKGKKKGETSVLLDITANKRWLLFLIKIPNPNPNNPVKFIFKMFGCSTEGFINKNACIIQPFTQKIDDLQDNYKVSMKMICETEEFTLIRINWTNEWRILKLQHNASYTVVDGKTLSQTQQIVVFNKDFVFLSFHGIFCVFNQSNQERYVTNMSNATSKPPQQQNNRLFKPNNELNTSQKSKGQTKLDSFIVNAKPMTVKIQENSNSQQISPVDGIGNQNSFGRGVNRPIAFQPNRANNRLQTEFNNIPVVKQVNSDNQNDDDKLLNSSIAPKNEHKPNNTIIQQPLSGNFPHSNLLIKSSNSNCSSITNPMTILSTHLQQNRECFGNMSFGAQLIMQNNMSPIASFGAQQILQNNTTVVSFNPQQIMENNSQFAVMTSNNQRNGFNEDINNQLVANPFNMIGADMLNQVVYTNFNSFSPDQITAANSNNHKNTTDNRQNITDHKNSAISSIETTATLKNMPTKVSPSPISRKYQQVTQNKNIPFTSPAPVLKNQQNIIRPMSPKISKKSVSQLRKLVKCMNMGYKKLLQQSSILKRQQQYYDKDLNNSQTEWKNNIEQTLSVSLRTIQSQNEIDLLLGQNKQFMSSFGSDKQIYNKKYDYDWVEQTRSKLINIVSHCGVVKAKFVKKGIKQSTVQEKKKKISAKLDQLMNKIINYKLKIAAISDISIITQYITNRKKQIAKIKSPSVKQQIRLKYQSDSLIPKSKCQYKSDQSHLNRLLRIQKIELSYKCEEPLFNLSSAI